MQCKRGVDAPKPSIPADHPPHISPPPTRSRQATLYTARVPRYAGAESRNLGVLVQSPA